MREKELTILRSNVNSTSLDVSGISEREDGLIMSSVPKSHSVGVQSGSETDNLVTHANSKDRLIPLVHRLS